MLYFKKCCFPFFEHCQTCQYADMRQSTELVGFLPSRSLLLLPTFCRPDMPAYQINSDLLHVHVPSQFLASDPSSVRPLQIELHAISRLQRFMVGMQLNAKHTHGQTVHASVCTSYQCHYVTSQVGETTLLLQAFSLSGYIDLCDILLVIPLLCSKLSIPGPQN